ncbi:sensor histidine kinase [Dyadobacter sp. Leaf189]|uniref:sensor histidine kinase n=1 Tax=Dyadobacter sp. Leaf189 TaxID=1736295 RepID=UPI0006F9C231|nr:histidine kinase [Dyadobacter sp. Leaf189]KQS30714.1 hypothetical protein ASG33_10000 [Dyadobacter sp. Leaf189]
MKSWRSCWLVSLLLTVALNANSQILLLEKGANRFLINEKNAQPRLDLIIQSFTEQEKREVSGYAVIDTVTKPTYIFSKPGVYHVKVGRMAERLIPVIRNADKLEAGYQVLLDGKAPSFDQRSNAVKAYMLGGEQCAAAPALPFGPDSITLSLLDSSGKLLSELRIALHYPKPELFYVNIQASGNANPADTTELRRFMHFFNRAPNRYSKPNAVPDSLSIAENELFFGFKKAYYDGKIQPTRIRYRIGPKGKWIGTFKELTPFIALKQSNENWTWLIDGNYELQYAYSAEQKNFGTYPFAVDHHWLNSIAYNSQLLIFIPIALLAKPWLALVIISGLIYLWFRSRLRKSRQQAAKTNLELQSIQSQLNPHFIFNALGSLQGLINKNEIDRANTYLSGFSKLMRNTLTQSEKDMVPLSVEISNIENYIKLEQLRFGFTYQILVAPELGNVQTEVPPLLIQPVVENAIKHGISALGAHGQLTVSFQKSGTELIIEVKDNGSGFDISRKSGGKGLGLTRERIKLLNKQRRLISMQIESDSNGTRITITLKQWL